MAERIHTQPSFDADYYINPNGTWGLTITCSGNSGTYGRGLVLQFNVVYNDGSTETVASIQGGTGVYQPGRQWNFSGTLTSYAGKTSARFYMHCNSLEMIDTPCAIGGGADGFPGRPFNNTHTLYQAPSGVWARINSSTHNSFNVTVGWTQGTNAATANITDIPSAGRDVNIGNNPAGSTGNTIANATPNTIYGIYAWVHDGVSQIFGLQDAKYWTHPYIENPTLSLVEGNEHSQIKAVANNNYKSNYDQYSFKLDDGNWTEWQTSMEYIFTRENYPSITGNSSHTIYTKMKNTNSQFESVNQTSANITTWYDPIYSLVINLVNRWFWYLETNCTVDYQGGTNNIKKYEFNIGNQGYQDKGTTNLHSRGSTSPTGTGKLKYNTDYLCKVRVTDNHGRIKEASGTFKTLDERPLYANGQLREVKVIKSDGSVSYVTPNLLSVIASDGKITNMNKIINNDDRTEFK